MNHNLRVLALGQALGLAGGPFVALVGGIVGESLAPSRSLATLPIATLVVGTALGAAPAAQLMKRIGRRRGFVIGALIGVVAALLAAWALTVQSFAAFCAATTLIGSSSSFVQQYRFAAAESVEPERAGFAISVVLLGGIAAGFLGPEIASTFRSVAAHDFSASFLALAVVYAAVALLMTRLRDSAPGNAHTSGSPGRSALQLLRQRDFCVAVAACVVGYATMSFIMTATPLSMHTHDGHSIEATSRTIQAHVVAMYLPSLFSSWIIARIGPGRTMTVGVLALAAAIATAAASHAVIAYLVALILLGLGWNLLFVGGTVLMTQSYEPGERFTAQATNDFIVFATQAGAALSAGAVLDALGWRTLILIPVPLLIAMLFLASTVRPQTPVPASSVA